MKHPIDMIRGVLLLLALATILLVGFWTQDLRHQIEVLQTRTKFLEHKLQNERADYDKLYYEYKNEENTRHDDESNLPPTHANLSPTNAAPLNSAPTAVSEARKPGRTAAVQHRLDELNAAITKVEAQLTHLNDDHKTVVERSKVYRDDQSRHQNQEKQALQIDLDHTNGMLQNLNGQLQAVRQMRGDPNRPAKLQDLQSQISAQRDHKKQVEQQLHDLNQVIKNTANAINQEVHSEENEIKADREQAETQLKQLKAERCQLPFADAKCH